MPLPFILGAAAAAVVGYGAKKGYDGYQDSSEADAIIKSAKQKYEENEKQFKSVERETNESLEKLGLLELKIGSDFKEFGRLAVRLLQKIGTEGKDLNMVIPQHQLDKIKQVEFSTTAFLGKMVAGGMGGAAAAYAVYGGVMALGAASTGTAISALSGAAAYNATMAAIGGGSLAAGGFGMAGGAMVLGGVVAAPLIAAAGWAYASHAEEALANARKARDEVNEAVEKFTAAKKQLLQVQSYSNKIHDSLDKIYKKGFLPYFEELKRVNAYVEKGNDIKTLSDEELKTTITNGYKVAAILTDIITTPMFRVRKDSSNNVIIDENNMPKFVLDKQGMKILNSAELDEKLSKSNDEAQGHLH